VGLILGRLRSLRRSFRRRTVLRLANPYAGTNGIEPVMFFARTLEDATDGEIAVKLLNSWRRGDVSEETSLLTDVARGRAELGWAGTRAFGKLGVHSLDPLQAPFLISSYEAEAAVCAGGVGREMLEPLQQVGLEGIAVLAGELRKPFGLRRPLLDVSDYVGARIRTHASVVGEQTFRLLGAVPILLATDQMERIDRHAVDGMDNHCEALASWGYSGTLTMNANLWPRTVALVMSAAAAQRLGTDERHAVREAGARSADFAASRLVEQEEVDKQALVGTAVRCVWADEQQLAELRERVAPVYDELRRDGSTGRLLARVEEKINRTAQRGAARDLDQGAH
jgi:TRAP-type C4-dicarboxylate transport system substrate-binding protein